MFKKIIGKTCKNPDCEFKDKLKEDFATMCDCGHALEEVTATDTKKVTILVVVLLLVLGSGVYMAIMKLKSTVKTVVTNGVGAVGKGIGNAVSGSLSVNTKTAMTLVSDGLKLAKENNLQAALDKFKNAIENDPTNAQAFGNLGAVYIALGRASEALDASIKAVQLEPMEPIWHLNVAELYSMSGDKVKALDELEAAFKNGFKDTAKLKSFNFRNIENDPKFKELVQTIGG
jgi:cytochrome c-type biogenesis protein CcmH/NrfG